MSQQIEYIEDIQMFLLNISLISRVKWTPYRETNCLYPNIIHIIFITLTNLFNSNTDVGRAGFGLAPRR